jgi:N-carbamoyl-L-amino-acid hydrolase
VDLRDPDESRLQAEEAALSGYLAELAATEEVTISVERLARSKPVAFDQRIVALVEDAAPKRGLASKRMTSGAGHDAQMITRITPSAMIFVPSVGGVSHNPREHTPDADLVAGANILLDVVACLAAEQGYIWP